MVLQGAEVLLYLTATGSEPQDEGLNSHKHWKRVMEGHAWANLLFLLLLLEVPLVASNWVERRLLKLNMVTAQLPSMAIHSSQDQLEKLWRFANDKDEDILVAEFDLYKIKSWGHSWGFFRDMHPELCKFPWLADSLKVGNIWDSCGLHILKGMLSYLVAVQNKREIEGKTNMVEEKDLALL